MYRSDFMPASTPIGGIIFDTDVGTTLTRPDGSVFLRTGTIATTASYPLAAKQQGLQVNGLPATNSQSFLCSGAATNGSGTWVLATAFTSVVLVSTDHGHTWTSVAHNNANVCSDVVWTGSRFVVFGNNTAAITASYSTTGTSGWTAGGSSSISGSAGTANTAKAAHDGTNGVVVVQCSATNGAIATFTDGTTLTARNAAVAPSQQPQIAVLPSLGATRWIITSGGASSYNLSSAADGSAYTSQTSPATSTFGIAAGNGVIVWSAGHTYYTSTNATTWTTRTFSYSTSFAGAMAFSSPYNKNGVMFDGSNFLISSQSASSGLFAYSSDGVSWQNRATLAIGNANPLALSGAGNLIIVPAGGAVNSNILYSSSWLTSCDYVGKILPTTLQSNSGPVANSAFMLGYVRVQ